MFGLLWLICDRDRQTDRFYPWIFFPGQSIADMVLRRYRRRAQGKPMYKRRYGRGANVRRRATYTSQVFTETFIPPSTMCPGVDADGQITLTNPNSQQAGKFQVSIGAVPQLTQYANLYTQYKILKAQFILMPSWSGEELNNAVTNAATGRAASESARFTYAINDDAADTLPPGTEAQVLQDNGAKIKMLTKPIKITCRPKPVLSMTNPYSTAVIPVQQKYAPWLAFDGDGKNINHVGIDWVATKNTAFPGPDPAFVNIAQVYCKLTFVLRDPR